VVHGTLLLLSVGEARRVYTLGGFLFALISSAY